jgi:hypothetical protein
MAENLTPRRGEPQGRRMVEEQLAREPVLSEPLTWQEICARHPDEWVVLVEVDWIDEDGRDFRSARVAGHGKTRREPLVQARSMWPRYGEIAHLFTGRIRARSPFCVGLG